MVFLALLLLLLQQPCDGSQQKTDVEVGVLFELGENPNAPARLLALHLALNCMSTGSTRYCPACESLRDSAVRLNLIPADAGKDRPSAEAKALQLVNTYGNLSGFIGPLSSSNSEGVASVLRQHDLSLLSPSATNVGLSARANFFRTTPSDTVVCNAIIELIVNLKYTSFVGVMEATGGGMSEGINRRMQELALVYGVAYQPVFFDGLQLDLAMKQLQNLQPDVILAVGDNSGNTFNLFQRLHDLRTGGQLAHRVLLGVDHVAGGNAPLKGNSSTPFQGVISFKSSGGGPRYDQFEADWPTLIDGLDQASILTVDGKRYTIGADHHNAPPSYVPETFEAAVLYAKAAVIMLEKKITIGDAMTLLSNEPDWYCLDRDPVKLKDRTRDRTGVSVYRHNSPGALIPSIIGEWSPTASLRITNAGELDDLMNPATSTSAAAITSTPCGFLSSQAVNREVVVVQETLPAWALGAIIALSVLVALKGVALIYCCCCQERLARCLGKDQQSRMPKKEEDPSGGPNPGFSSRRTVDAPKQKYAGCRATAIIGGGVEGLLHAIEQGDLALAQTNEQPTQLRMFTNTIRQGAGGVLEFADKERPWRVEVLDDHALELLERISSAYLPADSRHCWSRADCVWRGTRNVVDTEVEDELLRVLNRMLQEQNRRLNEDGHSVCKFRFEIEDYPDFQEQTPWLRWYQHFFDPDIADAVVVTGEACCLGLAGTEGDRPPPPENVQYALRISVEHDEDHPPQCQRYNAFLSLCSCRIFYLYNSRSRRGTLVMRITEAEQKSLRLPAATAPEGLGSDYSLASLVWPTTSDRSFDTLQSDLGIVFTYIKDFLVLFKVGPEFVRRIECARLAPVSTSKQAFFKGGVSKTPVVVLGRSAYISDILGRSFSCNIKGAFMSAVALRLLLFSRDPKAPKALEKLEAFLKRDRDDEMAFASKMKDARLPKFLDEVVKAGVGEDRFRSQVSALQRAIGVPQWTDEEQRDRKENLVQELAGRCQLWQRHTQYGDKDIKTELTSLEKADESPFRRSAVTLVILHALRHASHITPPPSGERWGVEGLPKLILRKDAHKEVTPQSVFETETDPLAAVAGAPGVAAAG